MLQIDWENATFEEMQIIFNQFGRDALYMSHYDLAEQTTFTATEWKKFLTETRVNDYRRQELLLLAQNELQKLTKSISTASKSPGTAQALQAMMKLVESKETIKEGPIFIYGYVPLNTQEKHSDTVRILNDDPFITQGE